VGGARPGQARRAGYRWLTRARGRPLLARIDRVFHRGETLPPVSLYKVGGFYFVLDGHHRVSVSRYHGVEWLDAEVTEFPTRLPDGGRGGGDLVTYEKRGSEANEMADPYEVIRQRREEMAREVKQNRLARELWRFRRRRTGVSDRALDLTWELVRIAGRLLKIVKLLREADQGRRSDFEECFAGRHPEVGEEQ
jgi:hypothetical protein